MAMKDINGEEFFAGDTLKVVKYHQCSVELHVGDVLECLEDDGTRICRFKKLSSHKPFFYYNDQLQKL